VIVSHPYQGYQSTFTDSHNHGAEFVNSTGTIVGEEISSFNTAISSSILYFVTTAVEKQCGFLSSCFVSHTS
jgi:hypothetical protein